MGPWNVLAEGVVERALVVVAHPDDADFWAGGTVAGWSSAGITVTYLVLTDGDAGGFDPTMPREDIPRIRRSEQEAAARILGVHDVRFLGLAEGSIAQGVELRRQIVRVIRQVRPRRLLTWSPEWNWSRFRTSCHIDHQATGEVALTAVYPDAGNAFSHLTDAAGAIQLAGVEQRRRDTSGGCARRRLTASARVSDRQGSLQRRRRWGTGRCCRHPVLVGTPGEPP